MKSYKIFYSKSDRGKEVDAACSLRYRRTDKHWVAPATLYSRAKASAKQHKKSFLLTKEEYCLLLSKPCYYCDGLLNNEKNRGVGLDRIDNSRGYEIDNVIRSCGFCNKTKGDRLTVDEMKKVAKFIIEMKCINKAL